MPLALRSGSLSIRWLGVSLEGGHSHFFFMEMSQNKMLIPLRVRKGGQEPPNSEWSDHSDFMPGNQNPPHPHLFWVWKAAHVLPFITDP